MLQTFYVLKRGNASIFRSKIHGYKSKRVIMAHVRYINLPEILVNATLWKLKRNQPKFNFIGRNLLR